MSLLRIPIIWRYVFREILGPSFLGLGLYVMVFMMNAVFELAELAIKKDLPIEGVAKILFYYLPRVLVLSLPMAILLGLLVGIGRLSSDSEVIALRASGVSYWRILAPALFIGALGWATATVLIVAVEPRANYLRHQVTNRLMYSADLRREIKPRVFFEELPRMLLYAEEVHQNGDFLDKVFLHQTREDGTDVVTMARRAQIEYDPLDGTANFFLESGTTHSTTPDDAEQYEVSRFERQHFVRPPDETFKLKSSLLSRPPPKSFREQSLQELAESIAKARSIDHEETRTRVIGRILAYMHERFALPFACLAFVLVGVPLGILNRRGGKASGFSLSVGIAIVYWVLLTVGQNLVSQGSLSPYIGLWMGNALLAGFGIFLFLIRERFEGLRLAQFLPASLRRAPLRAGRADRRSTGIEAEGTGPLPLREATGVTVDASRAPDHRHLSATEPSISLISLTRTPRWPPLLLLAVIGAVGAGIGTQSYTPLLLVALAFLVSVVIFSTTLDRYILSRFAGIMAGALLSFFTLFLVYEFVNLIDDLVENDLPVTVGLGYLAYRIPWIVAQILPISCLVSTLLAFGLMSRFNELTAAKASGTSIYRLATPVLIVSVVISAVAYINYDYVMPHTNQEASQIKDAIRGRSPRSYRAPQQRWVFGEGGRLYHYSNYVQPSLAVLPSAGAGTFQGFSVFLIDLESYTLRARAYARTATYEGDHWVLGDGWLRQFQDGQESFETFAEKSFDFPEGPDYFIKEWKTPNQMTFTELRTFVRNLRQRGYDAQELTVDLYGKTAFPMLPLIMVVVGLPFCFRMGRRGSLYGVGIAIVLVALFVLAFSATNALGGIGLLPPFLAAWAPNILFSGSSVYLLLRTST